MMREHGISNFHIELLETVEVTDTPELYSIERGWMESFRELGFELYNKYDSYLTREEARQKNLAYKNQKIPCPLCWKMINRNNIKRHQRLSNCI
jgi:hypothetical protein